MTRDLAWSTAFGVVGAAVTFATTAALLNRHPRALARENFRARPVVMAGGGGVALGALAVLAVAAIDPVDRTLVAVVAAALGGAVIGVLDDLYGDPNTKGLRGHLGPLRHGRVTPGAAKLGGLLALGIVIAAVVHDGAAVGVAVDALLVAGMANLVNLLDLRPGRAVKGVLLAGAPVAIWGAAACAVPFGLAAGLLPADLRERAMLGDGGANGLGAALGAALVLWSSPVLATAIVVVVVALTVASERASFSSVIERTAVLRWVDQLGRPA